MLCGDDAWLSWQRAGQPRDRAPLLCEIGVFVAPDEQVVVTVDSRPKGEAALVREAGLRRYVGGRTRARLSRNFA